MWYATSACIHSKLSAVSIAGRVVWRWAREESYSINITGPTVQHWVICIRIGVRLLRHSKTQTAVTKMLSCAQLQAMEMSVTIVITGCSRESCTGSFMLLAFTPAFLIMSQALLFVLCGAQSHPLFGGCGVLRFYRFSFCSQQPCFQLVVKNCVGVLFPPSFENGNCQQGGTGYDTICVIHQ